MSNLQLALDSIGQVFEFDYLTGNFGIKTEIRDQIKSAISSSFKHFEETAIQINHQIVTSSYFLETEKTTRQIVTDADFLVQEGVKHLKETADKINTLLASFQELVKKECFDAIASMISICVLPSLIDFSDHEIEFQKKEATKKIQQINEQTTSTAQILELENLEGVGLSHALDVNPDRKTVVYFLTNRELWQSNLPNLSDFHQQTGANVICYNYRGTGKTQGFPAVEADLIHDGVLQVRDLLAKGIAANKIVLYGHSFGASIATGVASLLGEEEIILDVCTDRCARNLQSVVKKIMPLFEEQCANFVTQFGWKLDPEADLLKLKGNLIVIDNPQDPITAISLRSVINEEVPPPNLSKLTIIKMDDEEFHQENERAAAEVAFDPHTRPFSKRENTELYTAIKNLWVPPAQ